MILRREIQRPDLWFFLWFKFYHDSFSLKFSIYVIYSDSSNSALPLKRCPPKRTARLMGWWIDDFKPLFFYISPLFFLFFNFRKIREQIVNPSSECDYQRVRALSIDDLFRQSSGNRTSKRDVIVFFLMAWRGMIKRRPVLDHSSFRWEHLFCLTFEY